MSTNRRVVFVLLIVLALVACSTVVPLVAVPTATPTRPVVPQVVVTTVTPQVRPGMPCVITATRTPAPNAPTLAPGGPGQAQKQVDPHVEICASTTRVKAGDFVTILGKPVDIGLPYYTLSIQDSGALEAALIEVTYDNQARPSRGASRVFEFESAHGEMNQVTFVLRAQAAGTAEVRIGATGEIHYGYPGPATYAGGGSDSLLITVEAR